MTQRESFKTEAEASDWMYTQLEGEDCIDSYRFAFEDNNEAVDRFEEISTNGCCGSFEEEILVNGREAIIGCNYGH